MINKIGFLGGGRITRIFLEGILRKHPLPDNIVVTETDERASALLCKYPSVIVEKEINDVLFQDYIFISLHPPVIKTIIDKLQNLNSNTIIISLAPKLTLQWFKENLGDKCKIIRCIPNAPSIVGSGFNPVAFSSSVTQSERKAFLDFMDTFGRTRIVNEEKLEGYALLTAMGPTYLWFQLYELKSISKQFGLSEEEINEGINEMVKGSLDTMLSDLSCREVMDLVPVRPLADFENNIREFYNIALPEVFKRIKP
jgi:pyrroline-5-carboxylate reductase